MSLDLGARTGHSIYKTKHKLVQPTVLTPYNPKAAIKVRTGTSVFGLGSVFLQEYRWLETGGLRVLINERNRAMPCSERKEVLAIK